MRILYNILHLPLLPIIIVVLLYRYLSRKDSAFALLNRLGIGLPAIKKPAPKTKLIWVHALSVGEVTSALPLVKSIHENMPSTQLVFSSTTASGRKLAHEMIHPFVDTIIAFPLDFLPVIRRFLNRIQPQLFILVETDFWPNLLFELNARNIPTLLVNGRISLQSMNRYRRYSYLFTPLFNSFSTLCMQTRADTKSMIDLGVDTTKLKTLGNLKYECIQPQKSTGIKVPAKPADHVTIICGSTHEGEEDIIFNAFCNLCKKYPDIHLILAPRNPSRIDQIVERTKQFLFSPILFTSFPQVQPKVLLVDTIGDLATLYGQSDIAFIGGSLVRRRGHNPLEAARHGIPVIFGPSMEDFSEIAQELLKNQAAIEVTDSQSLETTLSSLIESSQRRKEMGEKAKRCIDQHNTVLSSHLELIRTYV